MPSGGRGRRGPRWSGGRRRRSSALAATRRGATSGAPLRPRARALQVRPRIVDDALRRGHRGRAAARRLQLLGAQPAHHLDPVHELLLTGVSVLAWQGAVLVMEDGRMLTSLEGPDRLGFDREPQEVSA